MFAFQLFSFYYLQIWLSFLTAHNNTPVKANIPKSKTYKLIGQLS